MANRATDLRSKIKLGKFKDKKSAKEALRKAKRANKLDQAKNADRKSSLLNSKKHRQAEKSANERAKLLERAETLRKIGNTMDIVSGVGSFIQSGFMADARKLQGMWERNQAEFNAEMAEKEALQVEDIGKKEAIRQGQADAKLLGQQRAALAAQGIMVDQGTADKIQEETKNLSQEDQLTIVNNARQQALGLRMKAVNYRAEGASAMAAAKIDASNIKVQGLASLANAGASVFARELDAANKKADAANAAEAKKQQDELEDAADLDFRGKLQSLKEKRRQSKLPKTLPAKNENIGEEADFRKRRNRARRTGEEL